MYNYIEKQKATRGKEEADRLLLQAEVYIGVLAIALFLTAIIVASCLPIDKPIQIVIIAASTALLVAAGCFDLKIEQLAGYYECKKCKHRYVPEYMNMFWAPHIGRTRYMKCPECGERSMQKKVISKKKED